jgi:hypothetical protein
MNWQQWVSVLKLCTIWVFHDVRRKAIAKLASFDLDPVDKIILSKEYDVGAWLVPAINQLAQREEPLAVEDARRLSQVASWEFSTQLERVRETYRAGPSVKFSDLRWSCSEGCTEWMCPRHRRPIDLSSPTDPMAWPCPSCTRYRCRCGNWTFDKPAQRTPVIPRSQHDFTAAIRRVYDISS